MRRVVGDGDAPVEGRPAVRVRVRVGVRVGVGVRVRVGARARVGVRVRVRVGARARVGVRVRVSTLCYFCRHAPSKFLRWGVGHRQLATHEGASSAIYPTG